MLCAEFNKRFIAEKAKGDKYFYDRLLQVKWDTSKLNKQGTVRYSKFRILDEKGIAQPFQFKAIGEAVRSNAYDQKISKPLLSIGQYAKEGAKDESSFFRMCSNVDEIVELEVERKRSTFGFAVFNPEIRRLTTMCYAKTRADDKAGKPLPNPVAKVKLSFDKTHFYDEKAKPLAVSVLNVNKHINWHSTVNFRGELEGLMFSKFGISVESEVSSILSKVAESGPDAEKELADILMDIAKIEQASKSTL